MKKKNDKHLETDLPRVSYKDRIIWFRGKISSRTAFVFNSILGKLNSLNHGDIIFLICGEGGDFYACLKILHLINFSPSRFVVIAFEKVRSGCFFLTQADGCRVRMAVSNTKFIFHQAVDIYLRQDLKKVELSQKYYEESRNRLQQIDAVQLLLFSKRGRPVSKIFDLFNREARLETRLALKLNLIDRVVSREQFLQYKSRVFAVDPK